MKKIIKKSYIFLIIIAICFSFIFALSGCNEKNSYLDEDVIFYLDRANSSISGIPLNLALDNTSNITLTKDGIATIYIKPYNLNALLSLGLFDLEGVNIEPIMEEWIRDLFPGIDLADLPKTVRILKNSMGIELKNLDYNDPATQAMFASIEETGNIPANFTLPEDFAIVYSGPYITRDLISHEGKPMTGVYIGKHHKDTQPYLIMTITADEETGKRQITFVNEIIFVNIIAREL